MSHRNVKMDYVNIVRAGDLFQVVKDDNIRHPFYTTLSGLSEENDVLAGDFILVMAADSVEFRVKAVCNGREFSISKVELHRIAKLVN